MISKPVVAALVAALSVAAAGVGAYLAVRQNAAPPFAEPSTASLGGTSGPSTAADPATASALEPGAAPPTDTVVAVEENEPAEKKAPVRESPVETRTAESPKRAMAARAATPGSERRRSTPVAPPASDAPVDYQSPASVPEPAPVPAAPASEPLREAATPAVERVPETPERAPQRIIDELVVSSDSVIGLQMETTLTTEHARIEDRVEARVTRDVSVGDRTAIPAGARMIGSVTLVEKGGKVRERSRLGVRFHTLVLADGTTLPVQTETIFRDGDSPARESAAKIGGAAVGGAILGAIFGGAKGAIIGGSTGAAGGTAVVMAGDRKPAVLNAGTAVTVRLSAPVTVTVERDETNPTR